MSGILYCANTCVTKHGDEEVRVMTEAPSRICARCETRLHEWLQQLPDKYALLPTFLEHGVVEKNPESKATKSANSPAPMRLDIIDLLDSRRGRRWNGTEPTTDRRGVAGILKIHIDTLIEERPLTTQKSITSISSACALLERHRLWIAEQEWVELLYEDLRVIHRTLSDAVGEYRRPSVGHCHIVNETTDQACGGPLYANDYGGVRCTRCRTTWDANHLRQLGLAQAEAQQQLEIA